MPDCGAHTGCAEDVAIRRPLRPRYDFFGAIIRPSDNSLDCHVETPVLS